MLASLAYVECPTMIQKLMDFHNEVKYVPTASVAIYDEY